MTLTDFLLARIAEEEVAAKAVIGDLFTTDAEGHWEMVDYGPWDGGTAPRRPGYDESNTSLDDWAVHANRHSPARVLAECAAHRQIVERHGRETWGSDVVADLMDDPESLVEECGYCSYDARRVPYPCPDLLDLAAIYADHQDYREEWRA